MDCRRRFVRQKKDRRGVAVNGGFHRQRRARNLERARERSILRSVEFYCANIRSCQKAIRALRNQSIRTRGETSELIISRRGCDRAGDYLAGLKFFGEHDDIGWVRLRVTIDQKLAGDRTNLCRRSV